MFKLPDQIDKVAIDLLSNGESEEDVRLFIADSFVNPLKYFCPHGGQERYINLVNDAVQSSKISTVLLTSANGWGKSTTTIHILLNIIYGPQNGWFDMPSYRSFPFPQLAWYCTTSTALKNVIIPEIQRLAKAGTYKCFNQGKPTISMIKFDNGWQINFFTTDQDVEQFESATVGLIVADEPIGEPIYKALKSRKRGGNLMLMPMTPLDCEPFIIDEIVATAGNGVNYHITGSVYEASKVSGVGEHCGVRGHLDAEVIDKMVNDYDLDEREARVYGRFMYFSERIWQNFKEESTVVSPELFPIDAKKDRIFHIADPHDGRPCASIYFAIKDNGRVVVFSETPTDSTKPFWEMKSQMSANQEVEIWGEIEDYYGITSPRRIIDKRFGFQTRGGTNLATLFLDAGKKIGKAFSFGKSYDVQTEEGEIAYGHKIVRMYLEDMGDGYSKIVIWDNCKHLINGMKHYVRKRPKTVSEHNKAVDEGKPIERYKDFNDVLRYGLVAAHNYINAIMSRRDKPRRVRQYNNDPLNAVLR